MGGGERNAKGAECSRGGEFSKVRRMDAQTQQKAWLSRSEETVKGHGWYVMEQIRVRSAVWVKFCATELFLLRCLATGMLLHSLNKLIYVNM